MVSGSLEIYAMETTTYGEAVQDLDSSEIPAVPCPSAAAIVLAADPADVQSVQRHIQSVARSLATADSFGEVKAGPRSSRGATGILA
jgi:hypothetical protein